MKYNFDEIIDRRCYNSEKWSSDRLIKYFGTDDVLCFGVGDMDIKSPAPIVRELMHRAEHGIFGYDYISDKFQESILKWFSKRHNWNIDKNDLHFGSSILSSIAIFVNLYTEVGDQIIIQPPVYYPFSYIIMNNNRVLIQNKLVRDNKNYKIDFEDLEKKASDPKTKMMILCNPHNPIGRVWTKQELTRIGEICVKNNVLVISDDAHSDIVFKNYTYIPIASISEGIKNNSITCLSPAKTFNLAGCSNTAIVISNKQLSNLYENFKNKFYLINNNSFSLVSFKTAYSEGEEWLDEFMVYLEDNLQYLKEYINQYIPQIEIIEPQGTYCVWLNFNKLGLSSKKLENFLINDAKVALDSGYWYGIEGMDYARINIACPRKILIEGLDKLRYAINSKN